MHRVIYVDTSQHYVTYRLRESTSGFPFGLNGLVNIRLSSGGMEGVNGEAADARHALKLGDYSLYVCL